MDFELDPWLELVCLRNQLRVDPAAVEPIVVRRAVKALVSDVLALLATEQPEAAKLLQVRFMEQATRGEMASETRRSLDQVKHAQARALNALTQRLAELEDTARRERRECILARLDVPLPGILYGQSELFERALAVLRDRAGPPIVSIEGLGGIGKTSLALSLVAALIGRTDFDDILWVSARQQWFLFDGSLRSAARPALDYRELIDALAAQLEPHDETLPEGLPQRVQRVRNALKGRPYLVVIDNLETAQDQLALAPELLRLAGPTKFLLTTRQSLHGVQTVHALRVAELSEADLLMLVRESARVQGSEELARQPDEVLRRIYEVIGGNPLAAKLVVGQAHMYTLDELLAELQEARGRNVDDLYRYVYWQSWRALTEDARRLLQAMPLVGRGGGSFEQLKAAGELDEEPARAALLELIRASLVEAVGSLNARRYRIHQLTETFLLREVIKWSGLTGPSA
jgi:hypothetical protein